MHPKNFVALLIPVLAVYATPVKRDAVTVSDPNGLASVLQSVASAPLGGAPLTVEMAIPVTLTPGEPADAIGSVISDGLSNFALAADNKLLQSGLTLFNTVVSGTPLVELSSIGGPAVTLANPGQKGVTTSFAGATVTVVAQNGAAGVAVPVPLVTGLLGALGAVAGGAIMLL